MRVVACMFLIACGGGGSVKGEPLIQSTLMAEYNNHKWTPAFGFGRPEANAKFGLYLGSGKIGCEEEFEGQPRDGSYATVGIADPPAVGTETALINMVEVVDGDLTGRGFSGTVQVTAATATEVSAVYSYSTTVDNGTYTLTGAVTMIRCP